MKDLTIYNVYVEMESQEQCDRMKKLCIDNNLPIWEYEKGWSIELGTIFGCCDDGDFFILINNDDMNHQKVTEQEFINLLKQHKN